MGKRAFLFILSILLVWLSCYTAGSQPLLFPSNHKRYVIKTLNIENGLENNTVADIITDTFGFTWVGTKTALQRYDGYHLETIQPVINAKPLYIDYQVYFLQTNDHLLWITCKNGILLYNPFLDKFSSLISVPSSNNTCPLRPVEDTKEGVWCITDKGLMLYDHGGKLVTTCSFPDSLSCQSTSSAALHYSFSRQYLFLSSKENGILLFNKQTRLFSFLSEKGGALTNFTNRENTLYTLHKNGISIYRQNEQGWFTAANHFLQNNRFLGTIKIFQDGLLASTDQHMLLLDSNCTKASEITTLNGMPILSVGSMKMIYEDQFSRLWIITNNNIKVILNYNIPFQYFGYNNSTNFIKSIYVDEEKGLVLAGCYDGGLQLYDTLNNPLWQQPFATDKVKDIAGIEKLDANNYLLTTISQGCYVFCLPQKKITSLFSPGEEEKSSLMRNIAWTNNLQRIDSRTLIITTNADVIECRFQGRQLISYKILFHDKNEPVSFCHLDTNNNRLWIATITGLLFCKQPNGQVDKLIMPGQYPLRCVTTDAQSNVWAGTEKGLFVYDKNNRLIKTFTAKNGLLNDCIYSMLTDKDNRTVYAATNLGISALRLDGFLKNYTKERGLQENEFNSAATAKTSAGKLYFGGVNGVTAFYPADIALENDHPSLILFKADINDKPFQPNAAVWNGSSYRLNHNQDKISFSLTTFGIYSASDYTYEYKMDGFDKSWTATNNPVNISYHLLPGTYHFQARLVNFPSLLLKRDIVIATPFWQRWWFYVLLFCLVFTAAVSLIRFLYQRKYKAQVQALQIRQQVMAERERISRDLHDNIGAYASAISANVDDVLYHASAPDPAVLQRLKESAREIIIQLRDSIWALNKENQTVIMLSDRIKNYVQKLQPVYPDIRFDVDETIEDNSPIPSITALHVLRIVQEAVHNAIRHSGCSSVQINISSQSPVVISVEDDGRGMPSRLQYGEGLMNMQSRAADIGWHLSVTNGDKGCRVLIHNTN